MIRFLSLIRNLFHRDREAAIIKKQIAEHRRKHMPVRNLQAALTALRHEQLRGAR